MPSRARGQDSDHGVGFRRGGGLIGREAELERLGELLDRRSVRWVTVVGLGGVGKTALVAEILRRRGGDVVYCRVEDLGALSFELAVAKALGGDVGTDPPDALRVAVQRTGAVRLVIDGAELLSDEQARVLSTWLDGVPGLRLLVTSRRRLQAREEHLLRLEPLPLPAEDLAPEELRCNAAVTLLVERMRRLDASFEPSEREIEEIATLARALDGLPLFIEVCAPTALLLGAEATLGHLAQLMSTPAPGAGSARQVSIERILEATWLQCPAWIREGLAQTAVFSTGFTLAAVDAVVELGDGHVGLELIHELVDRSLAQLECPEAKERRFRIHDLVRAYARPRLGSADEVLRRHEAYFLGRLRPLLGPLSDEHGKWIHDESGELIAACARIQSEVSASPGRVADAAMVARALFRNGIRLPGLNDLIARAIEPDVMLAVGHAGGAIIAELCGVVRGWEQDPSSPQWLERARELAELAGDAQLRFGVLMQVVHRHLQSCETEVAGEAVEEMRRLLPQLSAPSRGWTIALGALTQRHHADIPWLEAQLLEARRLLRGGVVAAGALAWLEARLADLAMDAGRYEAAIAYARAAEAIADRHPQLKAYARFVGAISLSGAWKLEAAEAMVVQLEGANKAEVTFRRFARLARALLELRRQQWSRALAAFEEVLHLPFETRSSTAEAVIHLAICVTAAHAGERERARSALETATRLGCAVPSLPIGILCGRAEAMLAGAPLDPIPEIRPTKLVTVAAVMRFVGEATERAIRESLTIGLDFAWVRSTEGGRVALTRRPVLQRLVRGLVELHQTARGSSLTTDQLFELGWPDEKIGLSSARNRVRVTLTRLRRMGLGGIIERAADGGVRLRTDTEIAFEAQR